MEQEASCEGHEKEREWHGLIVWDRPGGSRGLNWPEIPTALRRKETFHTLHAFEENKSIQWGGTVINWGH